MATITINDLELDADLDREAMRKVFGGNTVFGRNSIGPVQRPTGSFQHKALSEKDTSGFGLPVTGAVIPDGSVLGAALGIGLYNSE